MSSPAFHRASSPSPPTALTHLRRPAALTLGAALVLTLAACRPDAGTAESYAWVNERVNAERLELPAGQGDEELEVLAEGVQRGAPQEVDGGFVAGVDAAL